MAEDHGVFCSGGRREGAGAAQPGFVGEDGEGDGFLGFGGEAVVVCGLDLRLGHQAAEMIHDLRVIGAAAGGDELIGITVFYGFENSNWS